MDPSNAQQTAANRPNDALNRALFAHRVRRERAWAVPQSSANRPSAVATLTISEDVCGSAPAASAKEDACVHQFSKVFRRLTRAQINEGAVLAPRYAAVLPHVGDC